MSEKENSSESDQVQESVKEAIGNKSDLSEAVRKITIDALANKNLDTESIKSTVRAVLEGAKISMVDDGGQIKAAFQQVTEGID
ncbi:DUF6781 family protein, partial [Kaarinaea lacus]